MSFGFGTHPLRSHLVPGILIQQRSKDQRHVGILFYKDDANELGVLHLAWHHQLVCDTADPGTLSSWAAWVAPDLHPARAESVSAWCRRIHARHHLKRIPYALSLWIDAFDNDGNYKTSPESIGLTCSSFILAVYAMAGIRLVDHATWQARRDDAAWVQHVSDLLASSMNPATRRHAELVRAQNTMIRIRPEETFSAGILYPPIAIYEFCVDCSIRVLGAIAADSTPS